MLFLYCSVSYILASNRSFIRSIINSGIQVQQKVNLSKR